MKGYIVNYCRVVLRKINARYLTVPACNKTHLVHTVVLDCEDPLVFYTLLIGTHKSFAGLMQYLLLVHVCKLFAYGFSPFLKEFALGWFQASAKAVGFSGMGMVSLVTIAKSMRKFKFSLAFSCVASLMSFLVSSLYEA